MSVLIISLDGFFPCRNALYLHRKQTSSFYPLARLAALSSSKHWNKCHYMGEGAATFPLSKTSYIMRVHSPARTSSSSLYTLSKGTQPLPVSASLLRYLHSLLEKDARPRFSPSELQYRPESRWRRGRTGLGPLLSWNRPAKLPVVQGFSPRRSAKSVLKETLSVVLPSVQQDKPRSRSGVRLFLL